jgi:hypothetical protein
LFNILLQNGSRLLLQNGTSAVLLESYVASSPRAYPSHFQATAQAEPKKVDLGFATTGDQ